MQKTQEERWSFSWEREVEFADLDTNAHVNSVILLRWMQEARTSYMRRKLMPELAARGEKLAPTVVAESTVEYLAPIFFPERVVVHLGIAAVGNSYFTLRYEIVKRPPADAAAAAGKGEATPCGRGTARLVCIDPQTQKKANLAPALRQLLEADAARCAAGSTPPAASASAIASPAPESATAKRPATPSDDFEEWPLCWVHEVEYRDLDVNVHANNCAVYYWMQEARVRWLDEVRSELSKIAPEEDFDAVMAGGTIQYMVPMLMGEEARVYIRLKQLGNSSMSIEHKIVRTAKDGKSAAVCYRGTGTLVSFDHEKQTKALITPALRQAIERVERRTQVFPKRPNAVCKL